MHGKKGCWIMAGVLIVLVAAMVVISFVIRKVSAPGTPVFAPGGQVVSGFPKELLLNHGAAFLNSYSINYSSSTDQYTAVWDTTSSVTDVYADYLSYFDRNGWVITKQIAQYPDSRGLFAAHGSSTASVAVSTHGTGSEVVVSYLPLSVPGTPAADDVLGRAPAGQLISEFLPGLVVDGNANIVDSFEGKSSGPNTRTFTTDYTSKLSVADLHSKYVDYFAVNKWTVKLNNPADSQFSLVAEKGTESVVVNAFGVSLYQGASPQVSVEVKLNIQNSK